jgi:hypothetical protein
LGFDPCDCTGVVQISALKIVSRTGGRCLWTCALDKREEAVSLAGTALWLSDEPSVSILSTGNDPQLYLKGLPPLPDLPLELRVWLKLEPSLPSVGREIEMLKGTVVKHLDECKELRTQVQRLNVEAEREGALEKMTTEAESLRAAAVSREERLQQLQSQVEALKKAVAQREVVAQMLERQVEALKASVTERESEITKLTAQTELLKVTVAEGDRAANIVLNSRSWRYTRPLRSLRQVLGR